MKHDAFAIMWVQHIQSMNLGEIRAKDAKFNLIIILTQLWQDRCDIQELIELMQCLVQLVSSA